jgi:ABC-type Mn2+/Zn2+ transport system permease subunit
MPSKWASRFIAASIIHGAIAAIITLYIVLGQLTFLKPEPSRVLAFGSAGMWFTFGYLSYILVGVVGVAVTALFYHYIEEEMSKPYSGIASKFAWLHLLLMNIGVAGATWLMMISGYLGGAAMLPPEVGGLGWNPGQVHANVFYAVPMGYPFWITIFVVLLAAGVLLGGLGYLITWRRSQ